MTRKGRNPRNPATELPHLPKLEQAIDEAVAAGLLKGQEDAKSLLQMVYKRFVESVLQGELQAHLDGVSVHPQDPEAVDSEDAAGEPIGTRKQDNKRNGTSRKTICTDAGDLEVNIPRDRQGSFEPVLLPKHSRHFGGLNEKIIAMYARGMSTRDIGDFLHEQYGVQVSPEYVSTVTDSVLDDIQEWQSRPLESMSPVVFFDALRVKIRRAGWSSSRWRCTLRSASPPPAAVTSWAYGGRKRRRKLLGDGLQRSEGVRPGRGLRLVGQTRCLSSPPCTVNALREQPCKR